MLFPGVTVATKSKQRLYISAFKLYHCTFSDRYVNPTTSGDVKYDLLSPTKNDYIGFKVPIAAN